MIKVSTEDLLEVILGSTIDGLELMEKRYLYTGRWSISYSIVVKVDGRFGYTIYEEPATEQQDVECRFPRDSDVQILMEMEPFEETITRYRRKTYGI